MREVWKYLLWTVGGPLLLLAFLNAGLFVEMGKYLTVTTGRPVGAPVPETVGREAIYIPKIGVAAPILLSSHDPTASWEDIRRDLEEGVSLAPGLARPGEEGTVWITGHSSDYGWRPGRYKTVFALLPALEPGDRIIIDYLGKRYVYRVTGHQVVSPYAVYAFKHRPGKTLTLMTCYPPLTTAKRWLVYAELSQP